MHKKRRSAMKYEVKMVLYIRWFSLDERTFSIAVEKLFIIRKQLRSSLSVIKFEAELLCS